eukprot:TRINITY_DN366_c0_g2_i1.p1 TRINITY_DN366_c0_g2~~TRINITY_DN366_c0_g2_i1.p1  ORF type:complete len:276 (+),score=82.72 TRINITY_DN366_c0_g2_i1:63-830(+)
MAVSSRSERRGLRAAVLPLCVGVPLWLLNAGSCYLTGALSAPALRRLSSRSSSNLQLCADGSKDDALHFSVKTATDKTGCWLANAMMKTDEMFSESLASKQTFKSVKVAIYANEEATKLSKGAKGSLVLSPSWKDRTHTTKAGGPVESKVLELRHHFMKVSNEQLDGKAGTNVRGKAPTKKIAEFLVEQVEQKGHGTMNCVGHESVVKGLKAAMAAGESLKAKMPEKQFAILPKRRKIEVNGDDVNIVDLHFVTA